MRLYYMTSTEWAEVILSERRLKLSRFYEANDPFELNVIDSRKREVRNVVQRIAEHHNKKTGMICCSLNWESPAMWAHYGDKHSGICIGIEVEDSLVSEINYTDEKINVEFGTHMPNHGLSVELLNRVLLTKATCWSYENERRLLAPLTTPDPKSGLYYTDFGAQVQLREVVIGYRCNWTTAYAGKFLGNVVAPVRVCKARPAFGRFEMIEQGLVRPITVKPKKSKTR
jgi:hypothetical protein